MKEPFNASLFRGLHRMPCQLVSLSGGGYRAALFHAGVMRALRTANILTREGFLDRNVVITAVSGGSITAMLWETFMAHGGDGWWPEEALLDLVTEGPGVPRFGNWGLFFSGNSFRNRWAFYLDDWWTRHVTALKKIPSIPNSMRHVLSLVELLDFESGKIFCIYKGRVIDPDAEFYKSGAIVPITLKEVQGDLTPAQAIFAATAFPWFFPPWRDTGIGLNVRLRGSYEFLDAGVIDNCALLPLIPLVTSALWRERRPGYWLISDAGAPIAMRDEPKHLFQSGTRKSSAGLRMKDRLLRIAGDLAQRAYLSAITNLLLTTKAVDDVTILRAGSEIPSRFGSLGEPPWHCTPRLATVESFENAPTALGPMRRDDSVAILSHGAQLASVFFELPQPQRKKLKDDLAQLL